jgi:hypothetical protein
MIRTVDEAYGTDADGNRGVTAISYELSDDDTPEIESQITEFIESTGELPEKPLIVRLIDPITAEDVEFEVDPFYYIPKVKMETYIKEN